MAPDVTAAFAAPAAKRLAAAVDKWLAEIPMGVMPVTELHGQRQQKEGQKPCVRSGSSWDSDSNFEIDPCNSGRGRTAAKPAVAAAAQQQRQKQPQGAAQPLQAVVQQRLQRTQLLPAALPPLMQPPPQPQQQQQEPVFKGAGKQPATAVNQGPARPAALFPTKPAPMAKPRVPQPSVLQSLLWQQEQEVLAAQQQQRQGTAPARDLSQQRRAVAPRPQLAGQKRQQHLLVTASAAAADTRKARPEANSAPCSKLHRFQASQDDGSSEDEFVAGSLKRAPAPPMPAAKPTRQASKPGCNRGRHGAAASVSAQEGFGARVEVVRLDTTEPRQWPGGCCDEAPCPLFRAQQRNRPAGRLQRQGKEACSLPVPSLSCYSWDAGWQASVAGIRRILPPAVRQAAGGSVVHARDILTYDLSRFGGGFLGMLLQFGDSLPPDPPAALPAAAKAAGMPPASGQTGARTAAAAPHALSWQSLAACLRLGDGVLPCGLVFVWASKASVAPAVRLLGTLGCKYVENLTWVQLGPDNKALLVRTERPVPLSMLRCGGARGCKAELRSVMS